MRSDEDILSEIVSIYHSMGSLEYSSRTFRPNSRKELRTFIEERTKFFPVNINFSEKLRYIVTGYVSLNFWASHHGCDDQKEYTSWKDDGLIEVIKEDGKNRYFIKLDTPLPASSKIQCLGCNKMVGQIEESHTLICCGLNRKEYALRYPNAPLASPAMIAKISAANKGVAKSVTHRQAISEAKKRK